MNPIITCVSTAGHVAVSTAQNFSHKIISALPLDDITESTITNGINQAESSVVSLVKVLLNIIIAIGCLVLGGIMIFNIIKAANHHRQGEGYSSNIGGIVICLICILLLATAPTWLYGMIGA